MDEKGTLEESFRKEVLKAMDKNISPKEMKEIIEEAKTSVEFLEKINEIELPKENYIVFTDGKEQLLYENGEFYIVSTTSATREKKKKTKKEATDLYLNYFIKYQLNPILNQKGLDAEKAQEAPQKEVEAKVQKNIESEVKVQEPKEHEKEQKIEHDDLTI